MTNPAGQFTAEVNGKKVTLFMGFSVLADLQAKHGQDVLSKIDPPEGAADTWMPDLSIVSDLFCGALQRFHSDVADRWFIDDLIAQNPTILADAIKQAFPDQVDGASDDLGNAPGAMTAS